jgi:hypothetical protein
MMGKSEEIRIPLRIRLVLLASFFAVGIAIFVLLDYIPIPAPYNWDQQNWNHIGVLPFATVFVSIMLLARFFKSNSYGKGTLLCVIGLIAFCSYAFLKIHQVEMGNINFNAFSSILIMISSWIMTGLLIWLENRATKMALSKNMGKVTLSWLRV